MIAVKTQRFANEQAADPAPRAAHQSSTSRTTRHSCTPPFHYMAGINVINKSKINHKPTESLNMIEETSGEKILFFIFFIQQAAATRTAHSPPVSQKWYAAQRHALHLAARPKGNGQTKRRGSTTHPRSGCIEIAFFAQRYSTATAASSPGPLHRSSAVAWRANKSHTTEQNKHHERTPAPESPTIKKNKFKKTK